MPETVKYQTVNNNSNSFNKQKMTEAILGLTKLPGCSYDGLVNTNQPHILCSQLPKHWRSNKSLPTQFKVFSLLPIPDGTKVWITAGNDERPNGELKNSTSFMHNHEAKFNDLRFLGRSGRGKSFNVSIHIDSEPPQLAVYMKAIKVTVDGPRVPRNKNGLMNRHERAKLSSIIEMRQMIRNDERVDDSQLEKIIFPKEPMLKHRKRKYNSAYLDSLNSQDKNAELLRNHSAFLGNHSKTNPDAPNMNGQASHGPKPSSINQVLKLLLQNIFHQQNVNKSPIGEEQLDSKPYPYHEDATKKCLREDNKMFPINQSLGNLNGPLNLSSMPIVNGCSQERLSQGFYHKLNEINKIAERILSPILKERLLNNNEVFQPQLKVNYQSDTDDQKGQGCPSLSPSTSNESPSLLEKKKTDTWETSSLGKGFFVQNVLSSESLSPDLKNEDFYWESNETQNFDIPCEKASL